MTATSESTLMTAETASALDLGQDAASTLSTRVTKGAVMSAEAPSPSCSACGSDRMESAAAKRACRLWRCEFCGTLTVWPQPSEAELADLYSKSRGYFATAAVDLAATSPAGARSVHDRLTAAGVPGRRILDVGCGSGQLIYHLQNLGWHVRGVDLNADAMACARDNGLDVITGSLESCPWPASSFDVVHMGDLIEHVPDPLRALKQAARLLHRGGVLMIRTPNADNSFATSTRKVWGRLGLPWPHSEAPYHLHEFTPRGLSSLIRRAGFNVLNLHCAGRTRFWYTLGGLGWFDDLKTRMKRSGRYRFDWRLVTDSPRLLGAAALLLPFHVYGRIADRFRLTGRNIALLARKAVIPGQRQDEEEPGK